MLPIKYDAKMCYENAVTVLCKCLAKPLSLRESGTSISFLSILFTYCPLLIT